MDRSSSDNPLTYKEFRLFITGRFLVTMAFSIMFITIEWKIYQITKDPLILGLIGAAEIIPAIAFSFISGPIVEKKEKRNTTLFLLFIISFIAVLLAIILSDEISIQLNRTTLIVATLGMVFLWGITRAFFSPTVFTLFSQILPREAYIKGSTWNSLAWQIGAVVGPAFGGFSYAIFDASGNLLLCATFFLLSFVLIFFICKKNTPVAKRESLMKSLKMGFAFILRKKVVLQALTLDMIAVLFGGAVALLPVFADQILHTDSTGLGILRAAPAFGAVICMLFLSRFPVYRNTGKKLVFAVFMFGVCIIAFGLSNNFFLSVFFILLSGFFDAVSVVIRSAILQVLVPNSMKARVSSINTIFVGSSNEFGALESGIAARVLGVVPAVVFGGGVTILVALTYYFRYNNLRNFEFKKR